MASQKNSGNRGSKRESGVSFKNKRMIQNILDDFRTEGEIDVHIGRVTKKFGNGRVEVVYILNDEIIISQANIRGSFRGKGKHSVWIDIGSIVALNDTGIGYVEINAVLTKDQARDLEVDPRIIDMDGKEIKDENAFVS